MCHNNVLNRQDCRTSFEVKIFIHSTLVIYISGLIVIENCCWPLNAIFNYWSVVTRPLIEWKFHWNSSKISLKKYWER